MMSRIGFSGDIGGVYYHGIGVRNRQEIGMPGSSLSGLRGPIFYNSDEGIKNNAASGIAPFPTTEKNSLLNLVRDGEGQAALEAIRTLKDDSSIPESEIMAAAAESLKRDVFREALLSPQTPVSDLLELGERELGGILILVERNLEKRTLQVADIEAILNSGSNERIILLVPQSPNASFEVLMSLLEIGTTEVACSALKALLNRYNESSPEWNKALGIVFPRPELGVFILIACKDKTIPFQILLKIYENLSSESYDLIMPKIKDMAPQLKEEELEALAGAVFKKNAQDLGRDPESDRAIYEVIAQSRKTPLRTLEKIITAKQSGSGGFFIYTRIIEEAFANLERRTSKDPSSQTKLMEIAAKSYPSELRLKAAESKYTSIETVHLLSKDVSEIPVVCYDEAGNEERKMDEDGYYRTVTKSVRFIAEAALENLKRRGEG